MTKKLLILVILALAFTTINGQTVPENDYFMDSGALEKIPEPEGTREVASEQPLEVTSAANDVSTQETPSEKQDPNVNPGASTKSNLRTTVFDGSDQVYVLVPAPNPFPNLGSSPVYLKPQPQPNRARPQYPPQPIPPFPYHHTPHNNPPMMPFMPMPHPMMFPPPIPQPMMIKPGDAPPPMHSLYPQPNQPGSQVILFNQQKNPTDAVTAQSTVYLKPDGNREVIIIK